MALEAFASELTPVTTLQMWQAAAFVVLLDTICAGLLWRRVSAYTFAGLRGWFPDTSAVVWTLISAHGLLGLAFWWMATRIHRHPLPILLVLGGLHSLPGHLHGRWRWG